MKIFTTFVEKLKTFYSSLFISMKFIYLLLLIFLVMLSISILSNDTFNDNNMIIVRSAFSSIIGFILENSSRKFLCGDKHNHYKILIVGSITLIITIIISFSYFFNIDYYNPSLILIKNTLLSCIGFLISSSRDCN